MTARFDTGESVRRFAVGATYASVVFACAAFVCGGLIVHWENIQPFQTFLFDPEDDPGLTVTIRPSGNGFQFELPLGGAEVVRLVLNAAVTVFTTATSIIYETTLRWTLATELDQTGQSRLTYNSNPRLNTVASTWANGRISLFLHGLTLTGAYVAASFVINLPGIDGNSENFIANLTPDTVFAPFAPFFILGSCLLIQALLAFAAYHSCRPPTWSSNTLVVAQAAYEGKCISRADAAHGEPMPPTVWAASPSARRILLLSWLMVIVALGVGITGLAIILLDPDSDVFYVIPDRGWSPFSPSASSISQIFELWQTLLIVMAVQLPLTILLHASDLIVGLARDESLWQSSDSPGGAPRRQSVGTAFFGSWTAVLLHAGKPVLHWQFNTSVNYSIGDGLSFNPSGMLIFSVFYAVLLCIITRVARHRREGSLPVSYGHIPTIVSAVGWWPDTPDTPLFQDLLLKDSEKAGSHLTHVYSSG